METDFWQQFSGSFACSARAKSQSPATWPIKCYLSHERGNFYLFRFTLRATYITYTSEGELFKNGLSKAEIANAELTAWNVCCLLDLWWASPCSVGVAVIHHPSRSQPAPSPQRRTLTANQKSMQPAWRLCPTGSLTFVDQRVSAMWFRSRKSTSHVSVGDDSDQPLFSSGDSLRLVGLYGTQFSFRPVLDITISPQSANECKTLASCALGAPKALKK